MKEVTVIGIDLAKHSFSVCGMSAKGKVEFKKTMSRKALIEFTAQQPLTLIAFEACGGSHYWSRLFLKQGHRVKMMGVQRVKAFAPPQKKNDQSDAEAIALAALQESVPSVRVKGVAQQDLDILINFRELLIAQRVALINQAHAIGLEYGVCLAKNKSSSRLTKIYEELENGENELTEIARGLLKKIFERAGALDEEVEAIERRLNEVVKTKDSFKLLKSIPGVGPITAAAILAQTGGDVSDFKNGRQFSAYLGLVPRQYSTGGKTKLGSVNKAGSHLVRKCLVMGTRSVLFRCTDKSDRVSSWANGKRKGKGFGRANVALANKTARIIFAVLKTKESYRVINEAA